MLIGTITEKYTPLDIISKDLRQHYLLLTEKKLRKKENLFKNVKKKIVEDSFLRNGSVVFVKNGANTFPGNEL